MAASLSPYPSPNEARAKRRGGRGFYKDRGLPHHDKTTERRDQRRKPEEREAAALGRALAELANQYPRFKASLNQLRHHVLVQMRSPEWKFRIIKESLGQEPMSLEDLIEETSLDITSVEETLSLMVRDRQAEPCSRRGGRVLIRRDGKPSEKLYWRRAK